MTQEQAIQKLIDKVISLGGDPVEYTFSVDVKMKHMGFKGEVYKSTETWFFVQKETNMVASGTSFAVVNERLEMHFGVYPEPVQAEVPEPEK